MKRSLLLLAVGLFLAEVSFCQLRIGVIGGVHQSEIIENNDLPNWNQLKQNYSKRTGGHFGFIADLPFTKKGNFVFQPGVIFYNKGRKYSETLDTTFHDTLSYKRQENLNYVDIPFNLVWKIQLAKNVKFFFGGGTYFSFFYNGNIKTQTYSKAGVYAADEFNDPPVGDGPGKYTTYDFGLNGLAGFEIGRVLLRADYSKGLNNIYESPDYTGKFKHQVMGVSLGVFLGKSVKMQGKDQDGDGLADKKDRCPDKPGTVQLKGCPDQDSDGIPDIDDACPMTFGPEDNKGCPYGDKDGDGVVDKNDKCPDVAGAKDNQGCPYPDADKDGIADKDDKCPAIPGLARYNGCPIPDTDGDGVNDEEDKCPKVKGTKENNGCPEIKKEIVEKVEVAAKRIQFKKNSAILTSSSFKVLDDVVSLLKASPELKLIIEGHTSKEGAYDVNMRVSKDRANSVKNYLQMKGVNPVRVTAIGYGPDRPLNDSDIESEQAKNRRVELKLSNQ